MGIYKFSLKMLRLNFKQGFIYLLSTIFPIIIIFNLVNIINNKSFFTEVQTGSVDVPGSIIFFLTFLICVFTFYANSYFVISKSKEMAIEELSGMWPSKLARIMLLQNTLIEAIGCAIGILIGILVMPIFLKLMYMVSGTSGSLHVINYESIWITIGILLLQLGYVSIGDYGYVSSREIIDMMNATKKVRLPEVKFVKLRSRVYIIMYLMPILSVFIAAKPQQVAFIGLLNMVFTVFGIQGVLRYYLPEKMSILKKEKYLSDKIKLIALSNVQKSFSQLKFLVVTLAVTIEMLLCGIAMFGDDPKIKTICIISYVASIVMIATSIIYKIILDSDSKKHIFRQLSLMGYTKKQTKEVIVDELKIFYCITIGIPLFHILIFFFLFVRSNIISIELAELMLGVFLVTFFITIIISYRVYKELIFKKDLYRI